ncbi:LacI family transcriptional regulator [Ruania suaedae]|uniref:LacI family DNA-binding transcriptional regulator n=1 Tax=Ruania suaedae TaxID=2897774 RepID=UPI001E641528|nr:LacI family DNA-binding transcriptional regulator [Ruania suaedae]UFU02552.1 LacI family transcriptional regulator [Ruania suaedae]
MTTTRSAGRARNGPSIDDVARLAGFSAQTVSRVAHNSARVRPATRERVLAAMQELGYAPNEAARALRSGAFRSIGLIARDFARTGEALTTQSIVEAAEEEDYSVTLLAVRPGEAEGWQRAVHRLSRQAVDGLIIICAEETTPEAFRLPDGLPVSVSDSRFIGHYPDVGVDEAGGARDAVEHLLGLGHRTVHHIAGPPGSVPASTRLHAWRATLLSHGLTPPPAPQGDWTAASGYHAGRGLLEDESVTAVFAANDEMAMGLLGAAREAGRQVPDDLSVVGFDAISLSAYSMPPLTTVHQDFHRSGQELVSLVLRQLREPGSVPLDTRVSLPATLLIRGTTGPPPR